MIFNGYEIYKKKSIVVWIRIVLDVVFVLDYWCYDIFIYFLI